MKREREREMSPCESTDLWRWIQSYKNPRRESPCLIVQNKITPINFKFDFNLVPMILFLYLCYAQLFINISKLIS